MTIIASSERCCNDRRFPFKPSRSHLFQLTHEQFAWFEQNIRIKNHLFIQLFVWLLSKRVWGSLRKDCYAKYWMTQNWPKKQFFVYYCLCPSESLPLLIPITAPAHLQVTTTWLYIWPCSTYHAAKTVWNTEKGHCQSHLHIAALYWCEKRIPEWDFFRYIDWSLVDYWSISVTVKFIS